MEKKNIEETKKFKDCLQRQVNEMIVLESVLSLENEFEILTPQVYDMKKDFLNKMEFEPGNAINETTTSDHKNDLMQQPISFKLNLCFPDLNDLILSIICTFPLYYPLSQRLMIDNIKCCMLTFQQEQKLLEHCIEKIEKDDSIRESEAVLFLIQFLQDYFPSFIEDQKRISNASCNLLKKNEIGCDDESSTKEIDIVLVGIHFHHIYNDHKKRCITQYAKDLDLHGFYKFGKPGRVIIEGKEESVRQYVLKIKNLHWQKMSVKNEYKQSYTLDASKKLTDYYQIKKGFQEIHDDSQFIKCLKEQIGDDQQAQEIFNTLVGM